MQNNFLEKFTNGKERYYNNPLFHQVIMLLENGTDPISLLDQILLKHEELTQELLDTKLKLIENK